MKVIADLKEKNFEEKYYESMPIAK